MSGENYLTLTGAELHSRGKAIYLKGEVGEECSDQTNSREIYVPTVGLVATFFTHFTL